jgi:hypothetical protein
MKEVDLAAKVIDYLSAQHWEIYQEVAACGSIADIVAVQGQLLWVIECKTSLSLGLIGQAFEWRKRAHFVSVAVPPKKWTKAREVARIILKNYGIGMLNIKEHYADQAEKPMLNRKAYAQDIRKRLCDKHKTWARAGSHSGYWTPFQETSRCVLATVRKNPGVSLKELIDDIKHHYSSDATARACISKWVQNGVIQGIETRREGKLLKFYPEAQ